MRSTCIDSMIINRVWAMPSKNTFSIKPIGVFVWKYLRESKVSIDPFARDCDWATYTNDLNPDTSAQYHLDALVFLEKMRELGIEPDLVIYDPPYSPRQVKECYDSVGLRMGQEGGWRTHAWTPERDVIDSILPLGGVVLSFGWNTCGMGIGRGYEIEEILLVCHGAGHNDTICMAERKVATQPRLIA
jgi:hypothetical protein